MILLIDRALKKFARYWRKRVFCLSTNNKKKKIQLFGKITCINHNVQCGDNVRFYPDVMLFGDGKIQIDNGVDIGNGTIIYASKAGGVTIGEHTMIAAQCYIIDSDHGMKKGIKMYSQPNIVEAVSIGKDVWIGAGAKILRGSKIGDGAVIGANSVVKGEIPENAIAVGCPAKVIKYREE